MELGLLQYFSGRYDDAFLELGILMEQAAAAAAAAASADAPGQAGSPAGGGPGTVEDPLPEAVLADAAMLLEKLRLELLVAV